MTTISEIVLIVCLVMKQMLEYVVSVGKSAAEEIVVLVGKLRCRWVVSPIQSESHSSSNKCRDALFLAATVAVTSELVTQ